jgi:DNA-directed RNA polymerase subunit RPC12/RpoP
MSAPVCCPECGHEVRLSSGWFGGAGGLGGGMRMMPGNSVIRCPACGHLFALPKHAPLAKQPIVLVVGGVIVVLILTLLLILILGVG